MSANAELQTNTTLFGTIVVDHNHKDQLKKMIDVYYQSNVKGFVVGGIHAGETAATRHELISNVRKSVKTESFVMTHGSDSLDEVRYNMSCIL